MQKLIDAIRHVTAKVQRAINDGHRSRMIDADDLVEVLLAIADELEAPAASDDNAGCEFCCQEFNRPGGEFTCPYCGTIHQPGQ
ncbi:MAG: hypothetical protein ACE5KM_09235 [Planctomycetaceae bacterium]